jgi:DNA-binding response OmpR family regulator
VKSRPNGTDLQWLAEPADAGLEVNDRAMGSIAIYERDDLMCGLLREWLTNAGYSVEDSGAAPDRSARVDLVIVSITNPKQEGESSIRHVRSVHPRAPIIALSSQARSGLSSTGSTARALGVEHVLAKPLTRQELLAAVESVTGTRRRVTHQ